MLRGEAAASDWVYFSAVDNITSLLVQKINAETVRIDISAWYLTEHAISIALVNRFNAGVPVRLIGDRGSIFEIDALTKNEFYWLASQGVPIRLRYHPTWYPEIDHWKAAIFVGQNMVTFGSANYTPFELAPASSTNYKDEVVLFSDDPVLVGAFKTKFDQYWNDTRPEPESLVGVPPFFLNWDQACARESACADYAARYPTPRPMVISTARLEPDYPMPPEMIWGQGPAFNNRLASEIAIEPNRVDMVIYRLTVDNITEALLNRSRAGVPVRLIVEPSEYLNRKWPEFWITHANLDKLWAAGVPMKQRLHVGLTHMKTLVTSTVATIASSNFSAAWQRDHNYFVSALTKPALHQAIAGRFEAMWNNAAGFAPFQPQPPDSPILQSPATGASGASTRPALAWQRAPFAVSYDVYLGTSPGTMNWVANVPAALVNDPPATYSWTPPAGLVPNTTYYWTVVSRTFANLTAPAQTASFTTGGAAASDLVVFRPSTGTWWMLESATGYTTWDVYQWGQPGDVPLSGDYDGDGLPDVAVFRPSNATWWILKSSANYSAANLYQWGQNGDVPLSGDYDGDGRTDLVVYRPGAGQWFVLKSGSNFTAGDGYHWGAPGDIALAGDFDGDRRSDLVVFRPAVGQWFIFNIRTNTAQGRSWGLNGDVPVSGDYDGDGRTDLAVYRTTEGMWYLLKSGAGYTVSDMRAWGQSGDVPVSGDFDGDGRTDITVYRPSMGQWFVLRSSVNFTTYSTYQWGAPGDMPVPSSR
jgi:phosphatidylserine/phosphatidylglycerophosphate/cardiolipin synthase-like enzyme